MQAAQFDAWLDNEFLPSLPGFSWGDLGDPESIAVLVVDLVRGFCHLGPLASARIEALVEPTAGFLLDAQQHGVRHFWMCCDEHEPDSPEFQAYPPHCLIGTPQAELHPRLAELPLEGMRRIGKGSLNAMLESDLPALLLSNPQVNHFVVVGDCTDLCIYSTAMHLRMLANANGHQGWQVWVPSNLVDTFDLPLETAQQLGALPHPADLCHRWALYQMKLNGCAVVRYSSSISA